MILFDKVGEWPGYFGEVFDPVKGDGAQMCDNSSNPPKLKDATSDLTKVLELINDTGEKFKAKDLISVIVYSS